MSYILFSSARGGAMLRGSERAYMGITAIDTTQAQFPRPFGSDDPLSCVGWPRPRYGDPRYGDNFLSGSDNVFRLGGGRTVETFTVCLNTLLVIGNDVMRLMARLHGQCELHAWVDGPNRRWLADIIDQGRASGVFRAEQGWEAVSAFLQEDAVDPVVTSFSVTDSFPNREIVGDRFSAWRGDDDDPDDLDERWEALSHDERWTLGEDALRENKGMTQRLEMRPDVWDFSRFYFGGGETAFTVIQEANLIAAAQRYAQGRML